jgi:hypothetical protein
MSFGRLRFHWNAPRFERRRIVIQLASASITLAAVVWLMLNLLASI